jgi:hypothetical protein
MSSAPTGRLSKENGASTPDLSLQAQAAVLPVPSFEPFLEKATAMSAKLAPGCKVGHNGIWHQRESPEIKHA